MALDGTVNAYNTATTRGDVRPNLVTLCGWAGTQRTGAIWSGDQYGGNWEYIRFHIPTFLGQSLSGNPNAGSDMDGIFSGNPIIATRDYQWKTFTSTMLDMDGWGSYRKTPFAHGDPYTGISRMYLKLKAQLMPYIYTSAASAANIDTGNGDTGLPMMRAMFLTDSSDYALSGAETLNYQFTFGNDLLVAPVYENSKGDGIGEGDDVRNGIYLPNYNQEGEEPTIWIDYFSGKQYRGGQVLENYDAPLWKLPLFVKAGAIIPMYEENNNPQAISKENPDGLDKTKRIVEFWPAGSTEYTLFEDDGEHIENKVTDVEATASRPTSPMAAISPRTSAPRSRATRPRSPLMPPRVRMRAMTPTVAPPWSSTFPRCRPPSRAAARTSRRSTVRTPSTSSPTRSPVGATLRSRT